MDVTLFDFELPEKHIALRPLPSREQARLLHIDRQGCLHDNHIADLTNLLQPGDALVFNDTKVIASALVGQRCREGAHGSVIHTNLHRQVTASRWRAFVRPAKRLCSGDKILFFSAPPPTLSPAFSPLAATVLRKFEGGEVELEFNRTGVELDSIIASIGQMPLPPYIASKRSQDYQDHADYQTIFARKAGAVAAPTAGLHFTPEMLHALTERGITSHFVTLHVGAGTFLPVKADNTALHKMHSEDGYIDASTARALQEVKARGGRVIAVGTTSLRLLESACDAQGKLAPWSGKTDIFITPGYVFRFVDRLITNFHLPRSTLFMLVCAFSGLTTMQRAYAHAIARSYRFYSYGDACLLDRLQN